LGHRLFSLSFDQQRGARHADQSALNVLGQDGARFLRILDRPIIFFDEK
jgi:hypothetical protein